MQILFRFLEGKILIQNLHRISKRYFKENHVDLDTEDFGPGYYLSIGDLKNMKNQ